jgi:hypothetical protein
MLTHLQQNLLPVHTGVLTVGLLVPLLPFLRRPGLHGLQCPARLCWHAGLLL